MYSQATVTLITIEESSANVIRWIENKLRYVLHSRVLFYIKETHLTAMRTISLTTKHCLSFAAIRLQGTSAIRSGFMVKYGPNTGLEDRTKEVRG